MTFQTGNTDSTGNWASGHLCYVLTRNLPSSCSCPQAQFKGDGVICSVVEIPREDSIQAVIGLLLADRIWIYSQKRQQEVQQKDMKMELSRKDV